MKKTKRILLSAIILFIGLLVTACKAQLVCISHIDKDGNGKCDNCGLKLDSGAKTNVKTLTIKTKPAKLEYSINEQLDFTGGVLLVTYNDETPDKELSFTDEGVKITTPGMGTKGKKMVAISYEGKTATYTIEVGDTKYTVSFNLGYDGAEAIEDQKIVINNKVTKPADPERSGFDFAGWYTSSEFTTPYDFEMTQVQADTTIYAKWDGVYTVTYNLNYEGSTDSTSVTKNLKAQNKSVEDRDTILFTGWYTDASCTTKFNFNSDVTSNLTLYAGWMDSVERFNVSFNLGYDGGTAIEAQTVVKNAKASKPADPTRENYDFAGWYKESAFTNAFNFDSELITADTVVYAKWDSVYTVTYNLNYEGAVNQTGKTTNLKVSNLALADRDTILFTGWYTDSECTSKFDFNTSVSANVTLYAGWMDSVERFTVSFDANYEGAAALQSQPVVKNAKASKPADPERSGYEFDNWYKESACTNVFNFNSELITADITLYAKWYKVSTVTYNPNYEGAQNQTAQTSKGLAENKQLTNRENYQFVGWYMEAGCTNAFDFTTVLTQDTTLYAKWIQIGNTKYNVSFNLGYEGAPAIPQQEVTENTKASKPADPTRENYDFAGWYKESTFTNAFNFDSELITTNTTIYAKWDNVYTVTYNLNYEGAVNQTGKTTNLKATNLEVADRDTIVFTGWYTDSECTSAFDFTTNVNANLTLYAGWHDTVEKYTVSFDLGYDGATEIPSQLIVKNNKVTKPADPERSGFEFVGWYKENTFTNAFDFSTELITADTTIYAKWNQIYQVTYNYNYTDSPAPEVENSVGGKAVNKVLEDRTGFTFSGWSTKADMSDTFDFNTALTGNITLYAKWTSTGPQTRYTVSFDLNYTGAVNNIEADQVISGLTADEPVSPTRASVSTEGHQVQNFTFLGWCTDKECKNAYDFDTPVTEDITLYAKWKGLYIFEAEHTSLTEDDGQPIKGMGASGGSEGANMIDSPPESAMGINASNGYYVTYLFSPGLRLKWVINSDRDVDNVTFIFRISCEARGYALTPEDVGDEEFTDGGTLLSKYVISLNGEEIDYPVIEITDAQGHEDTGDKRPFSDHIISTTLSLKKGENVIIALTANNHGMGGTMAGTAPVIDCIKLEAAAELSWEALTEQTFGQ